MSSWFHKKFSFKVQSNADGMNIKWLNPLENCLVVSYNDKRTSIP